MAVKSADSTIFVFFVSAILNSLSATGSGLLLALSAYVRDDFDDIWSQWIGDEKIKQPDQ